MERTKITSSVSHLAQSVRGRGVFHRPQLLQAEVLEQCMVLADEIISLLVTELNLHR